MIGRAISWRAELAPSPNRLARATLVALLCGLVVIVTKGLSLPETALSAYLIFFASKEESTQSIATSIGLMAAVFVAFGLFIIIMLNFTF